MNLNRIAGLILLIVGGVFGVTQTVSSDTQSGDWTIHRSDVPNKVEFSLMDSRAGHHFHYSSDWPVSDFSGLDLSKTERQEVHFTISRDAGKFECQGFLQDGEGAGLFHFVADAQYSQEMKSLGFEKIDSDRQLAMAIHDVSLKFAKEMKAESLQGLDTDKLIAFRIHGVTREFIESLRSAGLNVSDSDKLIAFRIHGVSPQFVADIRSAGLHISDDDKLIAFRIHGVSPEMIRTLRQAGYSPDADKLIAMRIHGATPEWVEQLKREGYDHV